MYDSVHHATLFGLWSMMKTKTKNPTPAIARGIELIQCAHITGKVLPSVSLKVVLKQ